MSLKWILNDRMTPTKLPVSTAVIIKTCAKPSNTTSYILFFVFFTNNKVDYILWVKIEKKTFPYLICITTLFVSKSVFFFQKMQTSQRFPWQQQDFPSVSFSTRTFTLTNKSLRFFPLLKPTITTSGKTWRCCASGVNKKLIFDKICLSFEYVEGK